MKFSLNSFNGCQVTERTRKSISNDQREITPKIYKAELWFLCMTHKICHPLEIKTLLLLLLLSSYCALQLYEVSFK